MNLYIFQVHEKASYVDGMCVIAAESEAQAKELFFLHEWQGYSQVTYPSLENFKLEYELVDDPKKATLSGYSQEPEKDSKCWVYKMVCQVITDIPRVLGYAYHDG